MDIHQILHEGGDLRKTLTVAVILMGSGFACHVVQKGSITSVVAKSSLGFGSTSLQCCPLPSAFPNSHFVCVHLRKEKTDQIITAIETHTHSQRFETLSL